MSTSFIWSWFSFRSDLFCQSTLFSSVTDQVVTNIELSHQDWEKPENIPDPDAKIPEDWDVDMDGEWEPPMIPNPEYQVQTEFVPVADNT